MKKFSKIVLVLILSLVVLAACGSKEKDSETANSSEKNSVVSDKKLVFKGKLTEDVKLTDGGATFKLTDILASEDPEKVVASFESSGVVLNAGKDRLPKDFKEEDFTAGTEINVTLDALPVTTRSIPPQVPSASIISIEKP